METAIPLKTSRALLPVLLLVLLATAAVAPAQKKKRLPRYKIDPYTENEPKMLERMGYVSYGPFEFGQRALDRVQTTEIDELYPEEELLWIETAHFKIGLGLKALAVPQDKTIKAKIRAELERLKERGLTRVNPKTRKLDRWLRVHMFAQRLEDHYARFSKLLGVDDSTFPQNAEQRAKMTGSYVGEGPYLGQKGKYMFLLFDKVKPFSQYMRRYIGKTTVMGQQWNFGEADALIYTYCAESPEDDGRLRKDTPMHAHVISMATMSLTDGYLHYNYNLPVWMRAGLMHWFERDVDPRFNTYIRDEGAPPFTKTDWKFKKVARRLASSGKATSFSELSKWTNFGELDFEDHVAVWSRWDYLFTLGDDKFAEFMRLSKGQIDPLTGKENEDLLGGVRDAMKKVYGLTPLTFDERWKTWVLETYPSK